MYLKVRDHEKQIAEVAKEQMKAHADEAKKDGNNSVSGMMEGLKAIGSAADFATADIRAAKDLHYNTQEYLWVKGQILAASASVITDKLAQAGSAAVDQAYTQAKKAYDEAKDDQARAMYKAQLDAYDQQRAAMQKQQPQADSALVYNRQLLSKYEDALKAYATELSKYEDKPGDVQKSLDQFQNDIDKTKTKQ